jgi:preprotein translocase subunit YajC
MRIEKMSILALLGIGDALAQAAPAAGGAQGGLMSTLPLFVILIVLMYVLVIRPQSKKVKEHRELITNLQVGDEIVTSGGIIGKITKITDSFMMVEIAEKIEIKIQKSAVAMALPKGTTKAE